jgi:chorismate mutase / prephenate dehydratase
MSHTDLSIVRARIDKIDTEIQNLIMQRAELAQEVAKAKRAEDPNPYFYRPERETEVLNKAKQRNHGVLPDASVVVIFREIMSACLALQKPLSLLFWAPKGLIRKLRH